MGKCVTDCLRRQEQTTSQKSHNMWQLTCLRHDTKLFLYEKNCCVHIDKYICSFLRLSNVTDFFPHCALLNESPYHPGGAQFESLPGTHLCIHSEPDLLILLEQIKLIARLV
jgi:hypothetical protein